MKKIFGSVVALLLSLVTYAQPADSSGQTRFESAVDSTWSHWQDRSYAFGFDPTRVRVPIHFDATITVGDMLMIRGGRSGKRWGYHCFEAYAEDEQSRLTMLLNKHIELGRPVAEIYYFSDLYKTSEGGYNWVRIGSDVRGHSFLFNRDRAVFFGGLELRSMLTLPRIGAKDILPEKPSGGNGEHNTEAETRHVNYKLLSASDNGTIFYDSDRHKVIIKIDGEWMELKVKRLSKRVKYGF